MPKYGCPQRFGERIFFAYNEGMSEHASIFCKDIGSRRWEEQEEKHEVEDDNSYYKEGDEYGDEYYDEYHDSEDEEDFHSYKKPFSDSTDDCYANHQDDDDLPAKPNKRNKFDHLDDDKPVDNNAKNNHDPNDHNKNGDDKNDNKNDDFFRSASPLLEAYIPEGASLRQVSFSSDGQFVAFSFNAGDGSDWVNVKFIHYPINSEEKLTLLPDTILNIKHSSLSWYKNVGIFYNRYHDSSPSSEKPPMGLNQRQKLSFHRLGSSTKLKESGKKDGVVASQKDVGKSVPNVEKKEKVQTNPNADDLDILHFPIHPEWHVLGSVTECQTYLVCHVRDRCRLENLVWIARIDELLGENCVSSSDSSSSSTSTPNNQPQDLSFCFRYRFDDWVASFHFVTNVGNVLYFRTNLKSEFYSIVTFDIDGGVREFQSRIKKSLQDQTCGGGVPTNFPGTNRPNNGKVSISASKQNFGNLSTNISTDSQRKHFFEAEDNGRPCGHEVCQRNNGAIKRGRDSCDSKPIFKSLTPKTVVPEVTGVLLESAVPFDGDKLILVYLENVVNRLDIFSLIPSVGEKDKRLIMKSSLVLPLGSVQSIFGRLASPTAYFLFASFLRASTVYEIRVKSGRGAGAETSDETCETNLANLHFPIEMQKLHQVPVNGFDADLFETKQVSIFLVIGAALRSFD